jgi:hypothetical protein
MRIKFCPICGTKLIPDHVQAMTRPRLDKEAIAQRILQAYYKQYNWPGTEKIVQILTEAEGENE